MNSHMHARLTKEQVKKIYDREFADEFNVVVTNIRSVTRGNAGFANSWKDWIGVGAISAGVITITTVFGLLAAFNVVPGFISIIANFGVAIVGVVAGIAFQKANIHKKREAYQDAELFLENELSPENVVSLRDKLFSEIYPSIQGSTAAQINITMKSVMAALANLIINKQVSSFKQLISNDFRMLLSLSMKATPKFAMNTRLLQSMLHNIPDMRSRAEVVDRVSNDVCTDRDGRVSLSTMKGGLWAPSRASSEPQLSFANEENFKSLHLR